MKEKDEKMYVIELGFYLKARELHFKIKPRSTVGVR